MIPDADKYRVSAKLADECAFMVADLIGREFSVHVEGGGQDAVAYTVSEVYEPSMDELGGHSSPAARVRRELNERVDHLIQAAMRSYVVQDGSTELASPSMEVYSLDLGTPKENVLPDEKEHDNHDMYDWAALVSVIIEKRALKSAADYTEYEDFEDIVFHVLYADDATIPDDIDLMRINDLLHAVLQTAREAAIYDQSEIPPSAVVSNLGKLVTREFGPFDSVIHPCPKCIRASKFCAHGSEDGSIQ